MCGSDQNFKRYNERCIYGAGDEEYTHLNGSRAGRTRRALEFRFSPIAFGSQTISTERAAFNHATKSAQEIHGFAPLPRGRFAFIGAIVTLLKINAAIS